jgi:LysM repeat protein
MHCSSLAGIASQCSAYLDAFGICWLLDCSTPAHVLSAWPLLSCLLLCLQMLLSTAQWLAGTKGFDRYGSSPTAADLEQPKACLYYAAAYLSILAQHNGCKRGEAFVAKAYHAGPKAVNSAAAALYWQKYAKARYCMRQVTRCMADTLAAAAVGAGLPLVLQDLAAADSASREQRLVLVTPGHGQQQQPGDASRSGSPVQQQQQQQELQVWVRAANLIAALSSGWDPEANAAAAASGQSAAAAAEAAAASSAASLMLHIFPQWAFHSKDQQQQSAALSSRPLVTQQQQQLASSSGSGTGVGLLRHWRSGSAATAVVAAAAACSSTSVDGDISRTVAVGSSSSSNAVVSHGAAVTPLAVAASGGGALAVAPVSCDAFLAALQRLACIDHAATETALSNAAARAAAAAAAAAEERRRARHGSFGSSSSSEASNAADSSSSRRAQLLALPCVMHVVGHGESLASIAAICGVAIPDILASNPDLPAADVMPNVQVNDCIALPVPAIPPRLHVVQHGDTIHSIARLYRVPLGRLLARNPELADASLVQQGWVVVLPGLKGESKSGAAMEWLAEAAAAAAAPELAGAGSDAADQAAPAAVDEAREVLAGRELVAGQEQHQQQQDADRKQHTRQDQAAAPPAAVRSSCHKDDTSRSGLDSSGSSPVASWALVGWHKAAAAARCGSGTAAVAAAAQHLPSVGSGAFMFAVGQASDRHAGCAVARSRHTGASAAVAAAAAARKHRQH